MRYCCCCCCVCVAMAPIGAVAASVVSAASPSRCLASSLWGSRRSLRSLHSNDALCAHLSGLVPPLRRHTGFRTSRTHKPGPLLILAKKRSGFAELFLNKRCVATTRWIFCNFLKTQNHASGAPCSFGYFCNFTRCYVILGQLCGPHYHSVG